jgi:hypothetical protein
MHDSDGYGNAYPGGSSGCNGVARGATERALDGGVTGRVEARTMLRLNTLDIQHTQYSQRQNHVRSGYYRTGARQRHLDRWVVRSGIRCSHLKQGVCVCGQHNGGHATQVGRQRVFIGVDPMVCTVRGHQIPIRCKTPRHGDPRVRGPHAGRGK